MASPVVRFFREAFDAPTRTRRWLVLLFVTINALVSWNAVFHDPRVGYDARHHLEYARVLSSLRLPSSAETPAFYSPPLPYVAAATALGLGRLSNVGAGKVAQLVQLALSIALTLALLRVCQQLRPGDGTLKLVTLGLCGMPAVYYRSFSFMRGEPYLACLGVIALGLVVGTLARGRFERRRAIALGVVCGAIALSRQMGFLLLVGFAAFAGLLAVRRPRLAAATGATIVVAGAIAFLLAGWFYLGLRSRHGTAMAWNLEPLPFSLANQPLDFYLGTGGGDLFRAPGRATFQNQLVPVLLSDWWGDYWYYFLVRGRTATGMCAAGPALATALATPQGLETNHASMLAYLGRVNLLAVLPSLVVVCGLVLGASELVRLLRDREAGQRTVTLGLVFLLVACTFAGFAWFAIAFPRPDDNDAVKATYVLQVVPLLALLGGEALVRLRSTSRAGFRVACALLVAVALHGGGSLVTRWPMPLDCWLPRAGSARPARPAQAEAARSDAPSWAVTHRDARYAPSFARGG